MEQQEIPSPPKPATERKDKTSYKEWKQKITSNIDVLVNVYDDVVKNPDFTSQDFIDNYVVDKIKDPDLNDTIKYHLEDLAQKRAKIKMYQEYPDKLQADLASLYPPLKIGENSRVEWHHFGAFIIINQPAYEFVTKRTNAGIYIAGTPFIIINGKISPKTTEETKKHELFHLVYNLSSGFNRWGQSIKSFEQILSQSAPFVLLKRSLAIIISRYLRYSKEEMLADFISKKPPTQEDKETRLLKAIFVSENKNSVLPHPLPNQLFSGIIKTLETYVDKNPGAKTLLSSARQAETDQTRWLSVISQTASFLSLHENPNSEEYKKFVFFFLLAKNDKLDYCERYLDEYIKKNRKNP